MGGMRWRDVAELVRAPAALSVPGDPLAGACAARWPFGPRTAGMAASSVCLYWAGMALNDYADRDLDADEWPERPIPSGRIRPAAAMALASGLTGAGLVLATQAGGRAGVAVAIPLAASVWTYDLALRSTPFRPEAMAAARILNVLMGSGLARSGAAGRAAAVIGAHTYTVSVLSRHDVWGTRRLVPAVTLAVSTALGVVSSLRPGAPPAARIGGAAAAAAYIATYGRTQAAAIREPTAANFGSAVRAGTLGRLPLQAALIATSGSLPAASALVISYPLASWLTKKIPP